MILPMPHIKSSIYQISRCIRSNIIELDGLSSDAATIANGIAIACSPSIDKFPDLFLQEKQESNAFNREYRKRFSANQYATILSFVLKWGNLLESGRQRDLLLSKNELPNSILQF